jgi:hypothetical protein
MAEYIYLKDDDIMQEGDEHRYWGYERWKVIPDFVIGKRKGNYPDTVRRPIKNTQLMFKGLENG